jgi:succinate-semialdehyde dehydrogenase/glutarate-semialdehyde dehydrogenase
MFQVIYPQLEDLEICYKDKRISGVSFTGSSAAGRIIYQKAAANLKKVVLELGGSDPMIVLDDAEIEMSVKLAVSGRLLNAGQTCIASKRFIVAKGCSAAFTEQLKNAMSTISTGDPCHNGTGLATLFAKRGLETAKRQLELAQQGHAKFILSPKILSETCISPGIITDISVQNPVYHQELFAPVALVYQAESDEDIVRLANDTPFGLAASICGKDAGRMQRIARQLECGSVFFNSNVKSDPRIPFGGVKESGVGRELGRWGIHEFCNIKSYCNIPR